MEILETFWKNAAYYKHEGSLRALYAVQKWYPAKPIKSYEERAADYYRKHGTQGEF